jgi:hypothetical protein
MPRDLALVMDSEEHLPDLSTAMSALVRHLETAVGGMSPVTQADQPRRLKFCRCVDRNEHYTRARPHHW